MILHPSSTQVVYDEPAEGKEDHDSSPEYPLVLLRAPFDHAYSITTYAQSIRNTIQSSLRAFEHLSLIAEVAQHGPAPIQKLVQLVRRVFEESVLA
jgi:hypothetical protein